MQEPFRFLCERLALELFHRGMLGRDDFVFSGKTEYRRQGPLTRRRLSGRRVWLTLPSSSRMVR